MSIYNKVLYVLERTLEEVQVCSIRAIDFILPDFLLLTPLRSVLFSLLFKIWKGTRIRKWQYFNSLWKFVIWNNCYVNRSNTFDNNALISIWDNCSIWYSNSFLTTSHYEKGIDNGFTWQTSSYNWISIWHNTRITSNCTILPWVRIWDNCIIAAWSVVSKDCACNWLYWWIPAKFLRKTEWFISKKY